MSRPLHKPTQEMRDIVKRYASRGTPQHDIAAVLAISDDTLRRHYREELDVSRVNANLEVADSLFASATKEKNVAAMIFWLKTQGRWKEPKDDDAEGGAPPKVVVTGGLPTEQL
jgi:hypothetical protein